MAVRRGGRLGPKWSLTVEFTSLDVHVGNSPVWLREMAILADVQNNSCLSRGGGRAYQTTAPLPRTGPEGTEVSRLVDAKKILTHQSEKHRKSCMNRIWVGAGRQNWEEVNFVSLKSDHTCRFIPLPHSTPLPRATRAGLSPARQQDVPATSQGACETRSRANSSSQKEAATLLTAPQPGLQQQLLRWSCCF